MDGRIGEDEEVAEVELDGVRAEFREALREEIDAATRAASAAGITLVNGRRIGKSAEAFQYAFSVENALSVPDDAPGDLYVPSLGRRVEAVVISVQGLAVTVSVNADLGDFVAQAKLTSNLAHLMRKLIERIEDARDVPNPGGDRLLGDAARGGTPADTVLTDMQRLNDRQRDAVAASIGRDTTFIWGPPGTGKTSTIGAIGEALYRENRSLLLVSHTNTAVDQALLRIAAALGNDLREGSVLRVGDPKDLQLAERDDLLLKPQVERRSQELVARRDELEAERDALLPRARELQRLIDVIEWLPEGVVALAGWTQGAAELDTLEDRTEAAQERARELRGQETAWQRLRDEAGAVRSVELDVEGAERDLPAARDAAAGGQDMVATLRESVAQLEDELSIARRLDPVRRRLSQLPDPSAARGAAAETEAARAAAEAAEDVARQARDDAAQLLDESRQASGLTRRFRGLPKPEEQEAVLADRQRELDQTIAAHGRARETAAGAAEVQAEVRRLAAELAEHPEVRELLVCVRLLTGERTSCELAENAAREAANRVEELQRVVRDGRAKVEAFRREHGAPSDVIFAFDEYKRELAEATQAFMTLARQVAEQRAALIDALRGPAAAVIEWQLAARPPETIVPALLATIEAAVAAGRALAAAHELGQLRAELTPLLARLSEIERELHQIAEALERIEDTVIAEATIIATTLTRAYLRDSVHGRRFDTVVLDEASMAPIPALWVAASLDAMGSAGRGP